MTKKWKSAIALGLCHFLTGFRLSGEIAPPTPPEAILGEYAKTQEVFRKCHLILNVKMPSPDEPAPTGETYLAARTDFRRKDSRTRLIIMEQACGPNFEVSWPSVVTNTTIKQIERVIDSMSFGQNQIEYFPSNDPDDPPYSILRVQKSSDPAALARSDYSTSYFRGYLYNDPDRVDRVLMSARDLTVKDDVLGGIPCKVINATVPSGHYTIDFDPARGGNILYAKVVRQYDNLINNTPLWMNRRGPSSDSIEKVPFNSADRLVREEIEIRNVVLRQFNGKWLPDSMIVNTLEEGRNGKESRSTKSIQCSLCDLNPTFTADDLETAIPNGTKVFESDEGREFDGVPRIWKDGKVVVDVDQSAVSRLDASLHAEQQRMEAPKPGNQNRGFWIKVEAAVCFAFLVGGTISWWVLRRVGARANEGQK